MAKCFAPFKASDYHGRCPVCMKEVHCDGQRMQYQGQQLCQNRSALNSEKGCVLAPLRKKKVLLKRERNGIFWEKGLLI